MTTFRTTRTLAEESICGAWLGPPVVRTKPRLRAGPAPGTTPAEVLGDVEPLVVILIGCSST